jgi:predicted N-acetyltransferase YhbS
MEGTNAQSQTPQASLTSEQRHPDNHPVGVSIRRMRPEDAETCGQIGFAAHGAVSVAHNVPSEQPTLEFAVGIIESLLADPLADGFVAERDGRVAGSVFLAALTSAAAIGPLTVHPESRGGVGRRLMETALAEARSRGIEQVRLVQSPAHLRSLALYISVGFDVREPLVLMGGALPKPEAGSTQVRPATEADVAACNALCSRVHGLEREHELRRAIGQGVATVAERRGGIVGYRAGLGFLGYSVADTTDDLKALIAAASTILGPGFFVPMRNGSLLRWLLAAGMRAVWTANLMSVGPYQEPAGAFLPSIAF